MIYSVNFMDLADRINPLAFSKYLKDMGWNPFPTKRTYVRIFQITTDNGDAFQVTIPLDKGLSDYKNAMYQAVETVALFEGQTTEQLMLFLLNPNTDILKIRLDRKDIEDGSIFFDDAIRVYENAKKLIAATAQDILHPRHYHQGRMEDSVVKFVGNCRFGQTEIGSYIVSVVCPFAELDDTESYKQLSIFSDEEQCANSLTRCVTNRIMTNVSLVKKYIDNGDYDKLISDEKSALISANFYEALTGLNLETENTDVEFIAQWSPIVKKNRNPNSRISISHDYYQPIVDAASKLRQSKNAKTKVLGRIRKLESSPDVSKRISGKISVVCLDEDDRKKTVTVTLSKEDYGRAIEAHENGSHVEIVGEFTNIGSRGAAMSCESFHVIE